MVPGKTKNRIKKKLNYLNKNKLKNYIGLNIDKRK